MNKQLTLYLQFFRKIEDYNSCLYSVWFIEHSLNPGYKRLNFSFSFRNILRIEDSMF